MQALFRQFSFPGGIPSHAAPETPGSIHEGGELGYSLAHAYGAVFDNPDLLVACVIGDGEAETGPLATSWQSNKFLHPVHDGTVLPILHLNGYKIANSTVLARIPEHELLQLLEGLRPPALRRRRRRRRRRHRGRHGARADGRDAGRDRRRDRPRSAPAPRASTRAAGRPAALAGAGAAHPEGLDRPDEVDGQRVEGTWRAHQVPLSGDPEERRHRAELEQWLRSYRPGGAVRRRGPAASPSCARSTRAGSGG